MIGHLVDVSVGRWISTFFFKAFSKHPLDNILVEEPISQKEGEIYAAPLSDQRNVSSKVR